MQLNIAPIWVRIYDLPISGRNMGILNQIGKRIGKVVETETGTKLSITRSVHMKVEIQLENH